MSREPETHDQMLAEIRRSQEAVRSRIAKSSWRYDLIYSTVAAVMVGGQAAPLPFNVLASGGGALAFALLWRSWAEKSGVSITGLSPKRARWVALSLGAVFAVLMLAALDAGRNGEPLWALPLAAIGFVAALAFSRLWLRVYAAETGGRS